MSRISTMGFRSAKSPPGFYLLAGLLLTGISSGALADDSRSAISLRYHFGGIYADSSGPSSQVDEDLTGHLAATYLYNVTPSLSLGVGYLYGNSDLYEAIFDSDDLKYQAFAVIAEGRIVLSERHRHSLYGRLSGLKYDYEIEDDFIIFDGDTFRSNTTNVSVNGTSISAAIGWSMQFDNRVGIEAGYEYLRPGSSIDIQTASFGVSYSF